VAQIYTYRLNILFGGYQVFPKDWFLAGYYTRGQRWKMRMYGYNLACAVVL
jgi:hypothetical protein